MFFKQKITIFAAACALFLLSSNAFAQEKIDTNLSPSKSTAQTVQKKKELPEIDGWRKNVAANSDDPDSDYIVNYDSEKGGRVTVYVYTRGLSAIPNGTDSDLVKDEMEGAKSAIRQIGDAGIYSDVKIDKNEIITLGGKDGKIKALHCNISFKTSGLTLVSELFLFGNQNKFVKIRASRPKELQESGRGALEGLLSELDSFFSK